MGFGSMCRGALQVKKSLIPCLLCRLPDLTACKGQLDEDHSLLTLTYTCRKAANVYIHIYILP